MAYKFQQAWFVIRLRYYAKFVSTVRKCWFLLIGMKIGKETLIPKIYFTWPHQIAIGSNCQLEHGIFFKFSGPWKLGPSIQIANEVFIGSGCEFNIQKGISIASYSNIASGCKFIDHDHGMVAGQLMGPQIGAEAEIKIGEDVWLGFNVVVLKGVTIGSGAVVGAGSVVTKSIPTNEIWAGVPAKRISERKL